MLRCLPKVLTNHYRHRRFNYGHHKAIISCLEAANWRQIRIKKHERNIRLIKEKYESGVRLIIGYDTRQSYKNWYLVRSMKLAKGFITICFRINKHFESVVFEGFQVIRVSKENRAKSKKKHD